MRPSKTRAHVRSGLAQVEIAKVGLAGAGRVSQTSAGGRLPFRRHIAGAGVSPRCAAVVLPCFKVRDVPYHIVVARLTSYGMCHWSTRVRRASHLEMRFRASCERPVATWSVISAWAARMPAASRECSHALEEAKSAHTQCHPPPDSKKTRKRSIKYSLRTSEPRRPGFSTPMSSKSPSAYLKASAKQCWYVCTPPHRHAWDGRRGASRGTADVRSLRKPDHKSPIFVPKLHARALEAGT